MPTWLNAALADLEAQGLLRSRRAVSPAGPGRLLLDDREVISFAGNDYLGLANDPRLADAACEAGRRYGVGATASPLVVGHSLPLRALENALAEWLGYDAALVFSSGFAANLGTITALARRGDHILSDALNHASLIDGARLSRAHIHIYHHGDLDHVRHILADLPTDSGQRWIVTDSVFSMDGDLAPLAELAEEACKHNASLIVDEAHAGGVLGPGGRGLVATLPNELRRVVVKVGTLSKAFGCQGGFVVGSRALIDWLINAGRSYIYSTALTPPTAAAARAALQCVAESDALREHLRRLQNQIGNAFGLAVGSPIVPWIVGDASSATALSQRLLNAGYLVPAIRPPTVPLGTARLRISLSAAHTVADIDDLIRCLRRVGAPMPIPRLPVEEA